MTSCEWGSVLWMWTRKWVGMDYNIKRMDYCKLVIFMWWVVVEVKLFLFRNLWRLLGFSQGVNTWKKNFFSLWFLGIFQDSSGLILRLVFWDLWYTKIRDQNWLRIVIKTSRLRSSAKNCEKEGCSKNLWHFFH